MKREDLQKFLGYNTHLVSHMINNRYNERFRKQGLTHAQAKVIYLLANDGEQTQTQLQKKLYVQASSMNGIIDSLLRHRRIDKKTSSVDRRAKLITLTDKGHEFYEFIIQVIVETEDEMTAGLSAEDKRVVLPLLKKMQSNLTQE